METERLIIRKIKTSDTDDIYEMRNSEFVMKYNIMKPLSYERMEDFISKNTDSNDFLCLELKESGKVMGVISLEEDSIRFGVRGICISYYLNEKYTSMGYMSEALREVIRYVFEEENIEVLSARVFKENESSKRLIERLGFVYEGCIRKCVKAYNDIVYDDLIYSIIKEEYFDN